MVEAAGSEGVFGLFEDDGETGYLYLYEPGKREVFQHLHIYDRTPQVVVRKEDVRIVWSSDYSKCGVMIFGKMRGIISLGIGHEVRTWRENGDRMAIEDQEWLRGFEL
jgi:hypothetical protein